MDKQLALKEWAVTVEALLNGELICVMRKGGIHEETKQFEVKAKQFLLMPAYEHQKEHLLKAAYQHRVLDTIKEYEELNQQTIVKGYAEVVEDIEITNEHQLDSIFEEHIWTSQFATERLKWKKTQPLHLLLLRVYRFVEPLQLGDASQFTGCRSWFQVEDGYRIEESQSVLTEEVFMSKRNQIKSCIDKSNSFI